MTNTIEDFKNAPIGATASHDNGSRVMKIEDGKQRWITRGGIYLSDEQMVCFYYTLDPIEPAPTTAREALDLAWELAHEVKEGQTIPEGTRYLEVTSSGLKEYTAASNFPADPNDPPVLRTLEPLPDPEPEPDWLDAPAVMARLDSWEHDKLDVFTPTGDHPDRWTKANTMWTFHWNELRDVTPLYPKGQEA